MVSELEVCFFKWTLLAWELNLVEIWYMELLKRSQSSASSYNLPQPIVRSLLLSTWDRCQRARWLPKKWRLQEGDYSKCGPKCGPSQLGKEWNGKGLGNRKGILGRPLALAAGIWGVKLNLWMIGLQGAMIWKEDCSPSGLTIKVLKLFGYEGIIHVVGLWCSPMGALSIHCTFNNSTC